MNTIIDVVAGKLAFYILLVLVALVIVVVKGIRSDLKKQKCCGFTTFGIACIGATFLTMIAAAAFGSEKTVTGRAFQYAGMCLLFGGGGVVGGIGICIDRVRRRAESLELQKHDLPPVADEEER